MSGQSARLAVDIGGTFTDLVLECGSGAAAQLYAAKVLTTHQQPAWGVLQGLEQLLASAALKASAIGLVLHGTTLATNALIERRGARTALLTTAGHRDVLEMAFENRFEQYDLSIDRPVPLVPRHWRRPVVERMAADGSVLLALDEAALYQELDLLRAEGVESLAIGLLHSYVNAAHEVRVADLVAAHWPQVAVTLSSAVCPEIREYERLSTTCANAYVQPLMGSYLRALAQDLAERGVVCPLLLMTSGGGLTDLETAVRFPIRLVESGPAGGAMLAASAARRHADPDRRDGGGSRDLLSFDMGGTTAKLCLINNGEPIASRAFEVDRVYRFKRGSGLPVRIPVIEMVEIGAGGGSIATVDRLRRVQVGPTSAGSEPGPVLYGRGGTAATVTDADLLLGKLDPESFRAAGLTVAPAAVQQAVERSVGAPLGMDALSAAFAISEVVSENMAAASRAHASEWGAALAARWLIAFGGAAPLHAARLAEKLAIRHVLVPALAGVGSALGFLLAPIRYEVVRSAYGLWSELDGSSCVALVAELRQEAEAVVASAAAGEPVAAEVQAFMRYAGQGYEIAVAVSEAALAQPEQLQQALRDAFEAAYVQRYGRLIPDLDLELMSWTLSASAQRPEPVTASAEPQPTAVNVAADTQLFDPQRRVLAAAACCERSSLQANAGPRPGPLLVREAHTTTVVPAGWQVQVLADQALLLSRISAADRSEKRDGT